MHEIRSALIHGERRETLATKPPSGRAPRAAEAGLAAIKIRREEERKANQRCEDRHLDIVNRAQIRFRRRTYEVRVLNVSSRGAMVACDLLPHIGDRIDIGFADCDPAQCFVRWVRGGRIGLEFVKETLIIAPAKVRDRIVSGRREGEQQTQFALKGPRAPRQSLMIRGELHWHQGSMPVKLRNISAEGAMLEATQDLDAHSEVVLEVPGAAAIAGRVRWCRSKQIGIRFDSGFDLDHLSRPEPEATPVDRRSGMLVPDYLKSELDPDSPWAARKDRLTADDL